MTAEMFFDPKLAASLNSMEGVPDWPEIAESPEERQRRAAVQHRLHQVFEWIGTLTPGVALALLLAYVGRDVADFLGTTVLGFEKSPFSAILVAIVLGLLLRNLIGLPAVYESGLRLCLKRVLRLGIVLLGLRLSLAAVGTIGLVGLPIILGCIATALIVVTWINRMLGLPSRLGSLIAVGTSICGVSAIVATGPVIDADDDEVSYAVACVTIFGMVALFAYPMLAHWLFAGDAQLVGLFLGTAIHDTAQVAGAGLMYQEQFAAPEALNAATVTKLVRNVCMAGVIPLVAVLYHRQARSAGKKARWHHMIPLFVLGFVAMATLRSIGDVGSHPFRLLEPDTWHHLLDVADNVSQWCLAVAMAAVGLGTGFAKLRSVGFLPLLVGLIAAVVVGVVSAALVLLLGPMMG